MSIDIEAEVMGVKKEVASLQSDVEVLKKSDEFFMNMVQRNTETNEKLVGTLNEVEKSMVAINKNIDAQTEKIDAMKQEIEINNKQVNERISSVKKQIDKVDEEGKFNIRTFLQTYLPWIVVCLGVGIFVVKKYVGF